MKNPWHRRLQRQRQNHFDRKTVAAAERRRPYGFSHQTKPSRHQVDVEGKDSWRHRQAGAHETLLTSPHRWMLVGELRGAPEPI
jgi:molybdopterin-guanine dinucleotide biosynthesis protein